MIHCVSCGFEDSSKPDIRLNMCERCSVPREFGLPTFRETRMLSTGITISKAWEKETEKRVIVPVERKDGGDHYVGTMEKGKIREKSVDIR